MSRVTLYVIANVLQKKDVGAQSDELATTELT